MIDLELYQASVSLDDSARRIKATFLHLPRVGETIRHEGVNYEVQSVVFDLLEGTAQIPFGYPTVFCRAATVSLGGDAQA